MLRRLLVAFGLTVATVVPVAVVATPPASAATCYAGFTYSGYVLHKSYGNIYVWNPNTGCENWLYIGTAKAYYCGLYEWFNGSYCPSGGGGGGGSW